MIVYVETNFILEIVFEQDGYVSATKILELSESNKIELAFPGFSVGESLSKVTRQGRDRGELYKSLVQPLQQLKRSISYRPIIVDLEPVLALFQDATKRESDRLLSVLERILKVGRLLELDISSFSHALTYKNQLSTEDSIVYGTIISDLKRRPHDETKLFISRDEKAFGEDRNKKKDPSYERIKTELDSYNCTYIKKFEDGLHFIEAELRNAE